MKHDFVEYPNGEIKACDTAELWMLNVGKSIWKPECLKFIDVDDIQIEISL